jgi:lysyl-tRNA synthetase class 2
VTSPSLDRAALLGLRHRLIRATRDHFDQRGFVEVQTPCLTPATVPEEHIDLFRTEQGLYLNASPEPQMKRLVARGMSRIYQIGPAFRSGEQGRWHNPEFTLLEWYEAGSDFRGLIEQTRELVEHLCPVAGREVPRFTVMTVDEAFDLWAGWKPSTIHDPVRFDLDLVERIEPALGPLGAVFVTHYPAWASSLARLAPGDPSLCERVELYVDGIELANGFSELTDAAEQSRRFEHANALRETAGKPAYDVDRKLIGDLPSLGQCAGIAVGIDRLVAVLSGRTGIGDVMSFVFEEL